MVDFKVGKQSDIHDELTQEKIDGFRLIFFGDGGGVMEDDEEVGSCNFSALMELFTTLTLQ